MKSVVIILVIVGLLSLLCGSTQGVCCTTSQTLKFSIDVGGCGSVGGKRFRNICKITICANGKAKVGMYCGVGCNIFGCFCHGCLTGNWQQSFQDIYGERKITIISATWNYF
ncbi:hypothetical protein KR222_009031 [Zaprionus bogoriensis]|nr:hypothetical protein KR222_009031 [Zaprionus bogoriensis]